MNDGTYTGTVDRTVDGEHAVFVISEDGEYVGEVVTEVEVLPENCRYDGALFRVEVEDDELVALDHHPERERKRRERIREQSQAQLRTEDDLDPDDLEDG